MKMSKFLRVIQYAAKAHDGQYRKGTDIPYISHPYAVGLLLLKEGYEEDIVCAGILHDIVEDTDQTLDDINDEFGSKVARIVEGSSEPNKDLPWKERKQHTLDELQHATFDIQVVVFAVIIVIAVVLIMLKESNKSNAGKSLDPEIYLYE